ncbi:2-phospho-L-lactate guanylyltransferase [Williamsia phyllosphaerae]|uniref:Phosphoenolpyruvate guanylyltransferase n=1 Tax=Williamsia phyllosphaerae TaxID=885042 RepID=A0ABQ1UXM2_9NOCA|nr:2-phospho-L-lactate guanylyltransferase [Williamsia phyllosphaerae]GGF27973.1 2-phospho-L-lactate guanylyltransferase [Williamsia phyllosphaerae]
MEHGTREETSAAPGARPIAAVLAVKGLADAKTRLSPVVPADARRALVLAMMSDTITAARAAGVGDIVVVTPDPEVSATARRLGARVVADTPADAADPVTSSLNRALARGIDAAIGTDGARVVVLQADLPALRAPHLGAALVRADGHRQAIVPDRSGSGTAMLIVGDTSDITPRFGVGSARAHRDAGAVDLVADSGDLWPDLRTDVDTVDDLAAAMTLGVGRATAQVLADVGLGSLASTPTPHAS